MVSRWEFFGQSLWRCAHFDPIWRRAGVQWVEKLTLHQMGLRNRIKDVNIVIVET